MKKKAHKEGFVEHVIHTEHDIEKKVHKYQKSVLEKFPFLFLTLSTFGGVLIFYGVEKIIDSTPVVADSPLMMIFLGLFILMMTGAVYRKLG